MSKAEVEPPDEDETDAAEPPDDGRPAFARAWPRTPALDALVDAFVRGDYGHVRTEAPALASRTSDDAEKRAALELRRRIDPDPVSLVLVGVAVALLLVLAFHYLTNNHAPGVTQ